MTRLRPAPLTPVERMIIVAAIRRCYEKSGLPWHDRVVWTPSPLPGTVDAALRAEGGTMHTYGSALALIGTSVPDHLVADAEVPVLTGPQAQGDLLVFRKAAPSTVEWRPLPAAGLRLVDGEATGNTHWLHAGFGSPGVRWAASTLGPQRLGFVMVPPGQTALLIHTDEHGANGIGPGTYVIHRKREQVQLPDDEPENGAGTVPVMTRLVAD